MQGGQCFVGSGDAVQRGASHQRQGRRSALQEQSTVLRPPDWSNRLTPERSCSSEGRTLASCASASASTALHAASAAATRARPAASTSGCALRCRQAPCCSAHSSRESGCRGCTQAALAPRRRSSRAAPSSSGPCRAGRASGRRRSSARRRRARMRRRALRRHREKALVRLKAPKKPSSRRRRKAALRRAHSVAGAGRWWKARVKGCSRWESRWGGNQAIGF